MSERDLLLIIAAIFLAAGMTSTILALGFGLYFLWRASKKESD